MTTAAATLAPTSAGTRSGAVSFRAMLRSVSMLIALVLIWIFFASKDLTFLGSRNLSNLAVELSITAVLSLGMLLIIVPGHIDLSIGSGVGLFGGLAAVLVFQPWLHWPAPAAMGVSTVLAVILWTLMGTLIVKERIPAFIITLAGLLIFKGLHWLVIQNSTITVTVGGQENMYSILTTWYFPPTVGAILAAVVWFITACFVWASRARRQSFGLPVDTAEMTFLKLFIAGQLLLLSTWVFNTYQGIPLSFVILAATALVIWVLSQHTRFGRYLYAIGGNEEAAIISGIPVARTVIGAFAIMGFLVALGGFMQTAYAGASTTNTGQLLELDAIAACVIGGTSLKGGRGTVLGVIFGSLIMASLLNGMNLLAVSPEVKFIARGAVLALAVWMDVRLGRK